MSRRCLSATLDYCRRLRGAVVVALAVGALVAPLAQAQPQAQVQAHM